MSDIIYPLNYKKTMEIEVKLSIFSYRYKELLMNKKEKFCISESDIDSSLRFANQEGCYSIDDKMLNKLDAETKEEIENIWAAIK